MSSTKVLQTAEANYKQKITIRIIASNLVAGDILDSKHCAEFTAKCHLFTNVVEEAKFVVVGINGQ
jgi:hypothetical protein